MTENISLAQKLVDRIWTNSTFHQEFKQSHFASVHYSLMNSIPDNCPDVNVIRRLLQAGYILAGSQNSSHRKIAYQIAVSSLLLYADSFDNISQIVHVIFGKLGNFPAAELLGRHVERNDFYDLPSSALYELVEHELANTIEISERDIVLTDFQYRLWRAMLSQEAISVSAPTSAGKSFALQQYLANSFLMNRVNYALYLVPTRALIHQVSDAINNIANNSVELDIIVSTIPAPPSELSMTKGIYVLTQERSHVLLETDTELNFDLLLVDEAQTIGDGSRGILLEVIIERLLDRNPEVRVIFGSPFSANPEHFSYLIQKDLIAIDEEESPVAQNLVAVETNYGKTRQISLSLYSEDSWQFLASYPCDVELSDDRTSLSYISYFLGKTSKNLVFAGSPAQCEKVSDQIRQWIEDEGGDSDRNDKLEEFSSLIREHIHPEYYLAAMVERGIAFHYGKMPTILRKAIEYYFAECPQLRYLICTSTLLLGVNLPAKNLFMLKPSEGEKWLSTRAEPMRSTSFWNLAGRAGRLGKDFEGNVFLVKKSQWDNDPMEGEKKQRITSSLYSVIENKSDKLKELSEGKNIEIAEDDVESAFMKLYTDYKAGRFERTIERSPVSISKELSASLVSRFENLFFSIPNEILENNISISPFRQQKMLDYLLQEIDKNEIDKLVPVHPEASGAYVSYLRLFSRYETKFEGRDKASNAPKRLAAIAIAWMKGVPYPQMIRKSQEYKPKTSLPTIIRDMMETIETKIRFKTVQYTRCYNDLLCFAFGERNMSERNAQIPAIPLYLEVGACSGTMVNLVGLGVSRTTAGLLNQMAANRSMDRAQCVAWLMREKWESADLPYVCKSEIETVLARRRS